MSIPPSTNSRAHLADKMKVQKDGEMKPIMFPRALVACISEARSPARCEFDEVTAKVLLEAWDRVRMQRLVGQMANAALSGRSVAG